VLFDNISITQTGATFGLIWDDGWDNKTLQNLRLIKGTNNAELDTTATSVSDLLSNTNYILQAIYLNGNKTETIELRFTTLAKATPTIELNEVEKTQTSFTYEIAETDTDNVGAVTKVELIHGDDTTNVEDLTTTTFDNLLSNNTYTVKITYVYNLNDGEGDHTITKTIDIKTETKATPDIVLSKEEATQTSVSYAIVETDTDNVGAVTKVELIHGDDTTNVEDLTTTTFDNLLSNNKYTVKVTYAYDLNDGEGDHTITKTIDITTLIKEKPDLTFENLYLTITSIDISLNIIDTDKTGILSDIQLLNNDVIINKATINEDNAYSFSDLIYGEEYTIKAVYSYDLCDGNGVQELIKELPISLNSKSIHETGSCKLDYSVNDDLTSCTITGIGECKHDDLYIPDNIDGYKVTALASYALKNCIASKITIGNNINSIGDRAFYACKNITEITVPSNINYIGTQIFIGCSSLKTVYWNTDATRDESVLNIASIEKVVFGDNLTYIPNNICYNCTNIKEVILSQNTSSIGNYAFYNCTGLKEIEFPEGLTYTGWYAFYESGLEKIILPSTITSVTNSFRGCHNLTTLVIPVGLTKIDGQAFYVCYNISEIYYIGEEFEWEVVSIDSCNTEVINANVYYYSENQPAGSGSYWHYVEGEAVVW
jgi:hypothetical protein